MQWWDGHEMEVGIVDAGYNRSSLQVSNVSARSGELPDIFIQTNSSDPTASYRYRLSRRRCFVTCKDLPIEKDQCGRRLR